MNFKSKNNLNFLRLCFAFIVCMFHIAILSNASELTWIPRFFSSQFAVEAFFVLSGILIFKSYENSQSVLRYFEKRVRRIYPAYFFVIICASVGLFFVSESIFSQYFSKELGRYFIFNSIFLNFIQPILPGVFTQNHLSFINGSLWTIKVEVMFYLSVPIVVYLFKRFSRLKIMLMIFILSMCYRYTMTYMFEITGKDFYVFLGRQLPAQMSFFITGAFLYYYFDFFMSHKKKYLLILAFYLPVKYLYMPITFIDPIATGIVVGWLGFNFNFGNWEKFGDFSYGLYVVHFPIIQTLITWGIFKESAYIGLLVSVIASFGVAIISWHVVEKRFLLKDNYYLSSFRSFKIK